EIRNSLIGIQCETFPLNPLEPTSEAKLKLDNAKIFNASLAGILSRNFRIESTNCWWPTAASTAWRSPAAVSTASVKAPW
ncbi:MAG: hypothetical protein KDB87_09660, partial [Flavobacteriales bacterium]|nr:hypothetical protein [Flavobacteriales bacterium]